MANTIRNHAPPQHVQGRVRGLLRLEGLVLLAVSVALYAQLQGGWGRFAALFLVPDLSMMGYLFGPRSGALFYNAGHSTLGPLLLAMLGLLSGLPAVLPYALIWTAHIGFDRALGYGLKYGTAFGHTHLGVVGRRATAAATVAPEA
jgi:hypothetical protein